MNREYLETLLKDFGEMLTTETVIGEPLVIGKVTIVPVVSVSFAFGSGGGAKPSEAERPVASAASAGARLTPVAFLSIHEDGTVNIHHVRAKDGGLADRVLEMAPGFIDKISSGFSRTFGKSKGNQVIETISEFADDLSANIAEAGIVAETTDLPAEVAQALAAAIEDGSTREEGEQKEPEV
ncbi:MAG: hypothetical protein FWE76_04485 [Symbiobacteriaceae bacterium]|nr:hypothetical protein [Symbiobacteriaceae bacterium]